MYIANRVSWDTNVKHYIRNGLYSHLPKELQIKIPKSCYYRWKGEPDTKYLGCEVAEYINQELELIKKIGHHSRTKKVIESYFKLSDTFHEAISEIKGVKCVIANHKDLIVNTVESFKQYIPVENAIKIFNISRATYQNYKILVQNKCDQSYFLWCLKKYPHQLLKKEILQIKNYMENENYRYWSKSSVYLVALRNKSISCGLSTWYKYCKLLGYGKRHLQAKKIYDSLVTHKPNELWCADVTIFKTSDGVKHYIHFLIDHYSKKILSYKVEKSSSAKTIKELLQEAFIKYRPNNLQFLTDAGTENVNNTVSSFLNSLVFPIKHLIAQKDVVFSNSMLEALNKVIKHQFLHPKQIGCESQLLKVLEISVPTYNNIRPQWSLGGNTPDETFDGVKIDFTRFSAHFAAHKALRIAQNKQLFNSSQGKNSCKLCV